MKKIVHSRTHQNQWLTASLGVLFAVFATNACDFAGSSPEPTQNEAAAGAAGGTPDSTQGGTAGGVPGPMGGAMMVNGGSAAGESGATGGAGGQAGAPAAGGAGGQGGAPAAGGAGGQGGMNTGGVAANYPAGPYGFAVGNVVADLVFADAMGNPKRLSDLRSQPGVKVILWSSGAEWCTFCSLAAPKLQKLHETRKGNGLAVLSTLHQASNSSQADAAALARWTNKHSSTYPLWVEKTPPHSGHTQNPDELIIDASTMKIRYRQQHTTSDLDAQVDDALNKAGS